MPDMLQEAQNLAAAGFSVLPVARGSKKPLIVGWPKEATTDPVKITKLWTEHPDANIGIATEASGLIVIDVDMHGGANGLDSLEGLEEELGPLPQSVRVKTAGGGLHIYTRGPAVEGGVGKLAPGVDVRSEGNYVLAPPSLHPNGKRHEFDGITDPTEGAEVEALPPSWLARLQSLRAVRKFSTADGEKIPDGQKHYFFTSRGGWLRHCGAGPGEIRAALRGLNSPDVLASGPVPQEDVDKIAASVARYSSDAVQRTRPDVPRPMGDAAFCGVAGEFVRLYGQESEASREALLVTFLTYFGNMIGNRNTMSPAKAMVGADEHFTNLFTVIVGPSSSGRKGVGGGLVKHVMKRVDAAWTDDCVIGQVSSGEVLVSKTRDRRMGFVKKKNGQIDLELGEVVVDEGSDEKRVMIAQSEFHNLLTVAAREGNVLGDVLRSAWDSGNLSALSKSTQDRATDAHISVLGHITREELLAFMGESEFFNGFANRFLWVWSQSDKKIASPVLPSETDVDALAEKMRRARDVGLRASLVQRNPEAESRWREIYAELGAAGGGVFGAVTRRAPAQIVRLSVLYAVLDGREVVGPEHLEAAYEVVKYAGQSARYVFGEGTGDKLTDHIYETLLDTPEGMRVRDFVRSAGSRGNAKAVRGALDVLLDAGKVFTLPEGVTKKGGRATWRWFAAC